MPVPRRSRGCACGCKRRRYDESGLRLWQAAPSHSTQTIGAVPGTEDLLDMVADVVDLMVPGNEASERLLSRSHMPVATIRCTPPLARTAPPKCFHDNCRRTPRPGHQARRPVPVVDLGRQDRDLLDERTNLDSDRFGLSCPVTASKGWVLRIQIEGTRRDPCLGTSHHAFISCQRA